MSENLSIDGLKASILVRRNARARRLSLRVSQLDGRIVLNLPTRVSLKEGRAFVLAQRNWIAAQLAGIAPVQHLDFGTILPVRGVELQIVCGESSVPQLVGECLRVSNTRSVGPVVKAWLREQARADLLDASRTYAKLLGREFSKITLRDTRSRWGSCSSRGALMYSWRLIMAPPEVLAYVAAHEVAHLEQMNHSPAFWAVVQDLMPEWRSRRDWLRQNGAGLHAYRFED